ncbi:PREDICTED: uncharacterized protein LOC108566678 [Nicrophorus vespilloides]|uniref:Uncharacterized protein LOC108566678 n=1 Tax=Nicrophorus vespilloides TaxID=110193 RepID=A0ABM1N5Q5_NICVS|nr:PREDICTED: uncharacterized protein LOC108566678 [Nicrophorus vespilloides]XP_017782156.1 PREDICTED: uncharacterized protein LOC108566678 [Nicrophorus vespilloides]
MDYMDDENEGDLEEAHRSTADFDDFSSSDDEQWEGINTNIANSIPKTDFPNLNSRNHWNRYNDCFTGPSTSQSRNVTPEAYDKYFMLLKNWLETARIDMNVGPPPFLPNVTMQDVISVAAAISAERRNADEEEQLQAMGAVAAVAASDGTAASSSYECRPAPIMRRIAAGVIDGIIVFMIKFYLIIILQDTFGLNLSSYADYLENPALFLNLSSDIAIMEFVSKLFIFVYETYFISRHGATPGKRMTGLRVVTVDAVSPIPGRATVKATAMSFVSWRRALFRSILKNIGLFLFPILYGFLISNYTRAGYDHAVKTLVIDGTVRPIRIEEN